MALLLQLPTSNADMNTIIRETNVRRIRKGHQVASNDSGLAQFADGIQVAPAENLMTERHVIAFFFSAIPAGQAWAYEEFAIVRIRNAVI
jgi:hypothetical protein